LRFLMMKRMVIYQRSFVCKTCNRPVDQESAKQLRRTRKYCCQACRDKAYRNRKIALLQ